MKYPTTFEEWQRYARAIETRAKALQDSIHEKGWKLAASVEILHCGCCLHNASIDESLSGWCFRNPERLKVAKQASHIVNDWTVSEIGRRMVERAWNHLAGINGWAHTD